jgi:hypothetical protein
MHGVGGVDDEVAQDLANLSFEAEDGAGCAYAFLDLDTRVYQSALIDRERTGDEFFGGDPLRAAGLLVEAQGLVGDDGDAAQLAIGDLEIVAGIGIPGGLAGEVEEVG